MPPRPARPRHDPRPPSTRGARGLRLARWVVAGLAGVQACRWLRVATSVQRHDRWWRDRLPRATSAAPGTIDGPGTTSRSATTGGAVPVDGVRPLRLVALGDSLAQGVGASRPERGFVGVLAARVAEATGRPVEIVNVSRTGVLVHDVLRDQVPALRALDPPAAVVVVVIGTNDAGRVPAAELLARFDELCGVLPDGALVADLPRFHRGRRRLVAAEVSAGFRDVLARHPRLVPVPLDRATAGTGLAHRSADLFHPNDRGHRLYADVVWAALRPRLPGLGRSGRPSPHDGGPGLRGGRAARA